MLKWGVRPAPSDFKLKHIFPSLDIYKEWIERERCVSSAYRRAFTREERLILFCKVACGWGRPMIRKKTGIAERQIAHFYKKMQAWRAET